MKKEQSALEVLRTGVHLLNEYLAGISADPDAGSQFIEEFSAWSEGLPAEEARYAVWRLVPKSKKRIGGYKVVFREVWQHQQKDGRSSQKHGIIRQIVYINTHGESLVIRVSPDTAYEEIIDDVRRELGGQHIVYVHPNDYRYRELREALREPDTPVIRFELDRYMAAEDDMLAQISVESIKAGFVGSQDMYDFLSAYVLDIAERLRLKNPREATNQSLSELVARWVSPDYPASFRNYVISLVSGKARQEQLQQIRAGRPSSETVDIERDLRAAAEDLIIKRPTRGQRGFGGREADPDRLKTVDEISLVLGIPRDTLYSWIRTERITPTEVRQTKTRPIVVRYGGKDFEVPASNEPAQKFYRFDDEAIEHIKRVHDERKQLSALRKLYADRHGVTPRAASKWVASRWKDGQGLSIRDIALEIGRLKPKQ